MSQGPKFLLMSLLRDFLLNGKKVREAKDELFFVHDFFTLHEIDFAPVFFRNLFKILFRIKLLS